jgi:hypothetical protein
MRAFGIRVELNVFEGCILDIRADPRDAKDFKVTYVEGSNKALFHKPLMAAPYHLDLADYTFGDEWMTTAQMAAKTAWQQACRNDSEAKYKKILLVFPDGYKLSQRGLCEVNSNEDGRVKAKSNIIAYRKPTGSKDRNGNDVFQPHCRLVWRFINTATRTALGLSDDNDGDGVERDVNGAFAGMT